MEEKKIKFDFVDILKLIAIAMVVNSHSKWMYPDNYQMLGIGGAWGCALFFFISGFTMLNMKTISFPKYVIKKIIRIYPAVWIWSIVTFFVTGTVNWLNFLWPLDYWFLCSLLVYYILFYAVVKYLKKYIKQLVLIGLFVTILYYIIFNNCKWIIDINSNPVSMIWYFTIMLWGAMCREFDVDNRRLGGASIYVTFVLLTSFIGCYGVKFVCNKNPEFIHLQLLFPFILFCTCAMVSYLSRKMIINKGVMKGVRFFSKMTLEIYIVQQLFIRDRFGENLNWYGAILLTIICSYALHIIINHTFGKIKIS